MTHLCRFPVPPSKLVTGYVSCSKRNALRKRVHSNFQAKAYESERTIENGESDGQSASVLVRFKSANVSVHAKPGQNIYELADENGIDTIALGCCSGNCGICEVEVIKFLDEDLGEVGDAVPIMVRSCVTSIPPGYKIIEINELIDDVWGLDGYDT